MKTTALAPWFGSNRTLAENVGKALAGKRWVGVAFAGGMCELAHIQARTIVASDLHRHVINLARVVADPQTRADLVRHLDGLLFHPDVLADAQRRCREVEAGADTTLLPWQPTAWAADYFVCSWMGRSAKAGTGDEFTGGLPIRFTSSGGDSNTRYRSAVEALEEWGKVFKRCNFHVRDAFDFIAEVKDQAEHGLYCDPPFPGPGEGYRHTFGEDGQRRLAMECAGFAKARVVMRFYDHELIRELYREADGWTWHTFTGRTQANKDAPEVLLVRN